MINIFSKLKEIIYNFFKKPKQLKLEERSKSNDVNIEQIEKAKNDFSDNLRKEVKKNNKKLDIIEIVNENTDVLGLLTIERLMQLDKMYDEKISEARRELEKLKMKINNML